jgi:hypothetical protein
MHGATVATVNDDDSYDDDNGVASVWHQDPPQAAQFKNGGHEWEGGRTPRKKARGAEASPISRPNHERAHAVAGAGIDAWDEDDSGDEDNALGDDNDNNADNGANDANDDTDDDDANDITSVGRRTQRGRRSDPADRASGWRRATTPTKILTKRRHGATPRTVNDDGPKGGKMTNDESASGGRGREPNHDRTVGPAVARTRTVLAGVQDFRQDPIALAALAVLNTPCQARKHVGCPSKARRRQGLRQVEQRRECQGRVRPARDQWQSRQPPSNNRGTDQVGRQEGRLRSRPWGYPPRGP